MHAMLFSPYAEEAAVLNVILQQAGFVVHSVQDIERAIEAWPERPTDFVLVALHEDHSRSINQIKNMRMHAAIPICVICDSIVEDLQVELLEAGADLVIFRPYGVRFLLAQILALLRRSAGVPFFSLPILNQRDVILDPANRTVAVGDGEPKRLTQLEFRLLYTLMTHPGQIIPTENIVEHVWGYSGEGNRELVRGLVQRLRSKVEPEPHHPRYILTELGIGYYFNRFDE